MELAKAILQEISADAEPREIGDAVPVQFNPTTLRLQLANQASGGHSRGQQVRQYTGSSSTTLTLDLIFDTADEGTTEEPVSVRTRTAIVEKYVLPIGEGQSKQAPPKLRFHWGELIIDGLVESVNVDFDHFAANGTPLRAKVGLSIKEQDSKYMYNQAGAGANTASNAPTPGSPTPATKGSSGSGGDKTAAALAGESAADFAARMGLDPAAWRGLAGGLGASLSLEAGLEIGFSANLSAGVGIGVSVGVQAGVSASVDASLGLEIGASAASSTKTAATQAAGFNLSAAGGVGAAVESSKIASAQTAIEQTRSAFQQPVASSTSSNVASPSSANNVQLGLPEQSRVPLAIASKTNSSSNVTTAAPTPPRADRRASTYAFGVPLRSTVGAAALIRAGALQGAIAVYSSHATSTNDGEPPETFNPVTPKWVALPDNGSQATSRMQSSHMRSGRRLSACGCSGRCHHR